MALAGIGSHFQLSSDYFKFMATKDITIENLLGIDPSHLKSKSIALESETSRAFFSMKSAASKDNIELHIVSGYRSFHRQKEIWERKFKQLSKTKTPMEAILEIITYSSIPGTSRHHWGTDIDLIDASVEAPKGDLLLEKHYHGKAPFSKMKMWMDAYSSDFGFELVYTKQQDRTGFNYEPWHYSYAPKSRLFLKLQSKDNFKKAWYGLSFKAKSSMSNSFVDAYFQNYGLGINPSLMPS